MKTYQKIVMSELEQLLVQGQVLIFDLRDRLNYGCGHIDNAINLNQENIHSLLVNMNKKIPIVFYSSSIKKTIMMAKLFADLGFVKSHYLAGSYEDWLDYQEQKKSMSESLYQWLIAQGYDGTDIDQRGFNGETPLMTAARTGQLEYLIELIDHGAQLDVVNNDGNSAVWLACYSNNIYVLLALVQEAANINIQNDNGASPLIYAASSGRLDMVQLLLQAGANKDLATLDGFTALDVASSFEILTLLRLVNKMGQLALQPLQYLKAS